MLNKKELPKGDWFFRNTKDLYNYNLIKDSLPGSSETIGIPTYDYTTVQKLYFHDIARQNTISFRISTAVLDTMKDENISTTYTVRIKEFIIHFVKKITRRFNVI